VPAWDKSQYGAAMRDRGKAGHRRDSSVTDAFRVRSDGPLSHPLQGTATVGGAKNSALKLMSAALLAPGRTVLTNVPDILDVTVMAQLLERLGCTVEVRHDEQARVTVEVPEELSYEAPYDLVRRLRASISVLGPLVARCGRARVALPGGDNIGSRGLDMHLTGLRELGASVTIEHGYVVAHAGAGLAGTNLWLDFPSVGATENLLMAAVLTPGRTVIDNVAREPEIADLCEMLVEMGAHVDGISTSTLTVEGVDRLHPVEHATVPDRIVAGTWAFAAAIAGGDLTVRGGRADHLDIALDKMGSAGANVEAFDDGFRVHVDRRLAAFDVVTLPYPGFPTDLQPFAMALASVSDGSAMITENVFEARFMFAQELARLGADLRTDGHHAVVRGTASLSGAPVMAHDIRAGAALVLAGLAAEGTTEVAESHHIDRGYPRFAEALQSLGADVTRMSLDDQSA
jgi:UDP-N-acetylglucosamine 1-carboxyvinyltransferase